MEIKKTNRGGRGAKSRVPDRPICNKYNSSQFSTPVNTLTLACEERWKLQEERKKEIFKQVDSKNL
jgi:hypothetical protein